MTALITVLASAFTSLLPAEPPTMCTRVVANRILYPGVAITTEDLYVIKIPCGMHPAPQGSQFSTRAPVIGRVPRERVLSNELLRSERLHRHHGHVPPSHHGVLVPRTDDPWTIGDLVQVDSTQAIVTFVGPDMLGLAMPSAEAHAWAGAALSTTPSLEHTGHLPTPRVPREALYASGKRKILCGRGPAVVVEPATPEP